MSTEEDIATIEAVTAKVAGPLKVWVFTIQHDGEKYVHLHYSYEGVLVTLRNDLATGYSVQLSQEEIDKLVEHFRHHADLLFRDTQYVANQREILA